MASMTGTHLTTVAHHSEYCHRDIYPACEKSSEPLFIILYNFYGLIVMQSKGIDLELYDLFCFI
jgi:hypothetical protein